MRQELTPSARLIGKNFGRTDLNLLLAAEREGLPVITGNNKLLNQILDPPIRKLLIGEAEIYVLERDIPINADLGVI